MGSPTAAPNQTRRYRGRILCTTGCPRIAQRTKAVSSSLSTVTQVPWLKSNAAGPSTTVQNQP